jgi:membrane associated rhomboid family serine protease
MLVPYGHDDLRGRRWPWVTIALIVLNLVAFMATKDRMQEESVRAVHLHAETLLIVASHPDVHLTPAQQKIVDRIRTQAPDALDEIKTNSREAAHEMGVEAPDGLNDEEAQDEATRLGQKIDDLDRHSIMGQYAYTPGKSNFISLFTANFLHGGWLHLIGNMWFLWLAGTVLEDAWGRVMYSIFYIVAGAVALLAQGAAMHGAPGGVLGASGAIAGLMGAFLVRFPMTKIKFFFFIFIMRIRFKAPAYAMLPLWLGEQLLWAFGPGGGIAYWAHIGGFAFGGVVALALRFSGANEKLDKAVEEKVSWSADPRIEQAHEAIRQNDLDGGIGLLKNLIAEKPETVDAHDLLQQCYLRKQDVESARAEAAISCKLNLKARENDLAWKNYEDFLNMGGEKFPNTEWMALCRYLEGQQSWIRAAGEYEKIGQVYSSERTSVNALVSAARVQLKHVGNKDEAARLYRAAQDSPVPHLDWEEAIKKGLAECGAPTGSTPAPFPVPSVK